MKRILLILVGLVIASTLCGQTLLYEGFDGDFPPAGWTSIKTATSGAVNNNRGWIQVSEMPNISTSSITGTQTHSLHDVKGALDTPNAVAAENIVQGSDGFLPNNYLITPPLKTIPGESYTVTFYVQRRNGGSLYVYTNNREVTGAEPVMADFPTATSGNTLMDSITSNLNSWTLRTATFTASYSVSYVAFRYQGPSSGTRGPIMIDEVHIRKTNPDPAIVNNLYIQSFTGATKVRQGLPHTYNVVVRNDGTAAVSADNYSVKLYRVLPDGSAIINDLIATAPSTPAISAGATASFSFTYTPDGTEPRLWEIYAEVDYTNGTFDDYPDGNRRSLFLEEAATVVSNGKATATHPNHIRFNEIAPWRVAWAANAITMTIYQKENLTGLKAGDTIESLTFTASRGTSDMANTTVSELSIMINNTTKNSFANASDWFTQAEAGGNYIWTATVAAAFPATTANAGFIDIKVTLNPPLVYDGNNLVIVGRNLNGSAGVNLYFVGHSTLAGINNQVLGHAAGGWPTSDATGNLAYSALPRVNFGVSSLPAPITYGTLSGTVRDSNGNTASGVEVELLGTGRTVKTNASGQFTFTDFPSNADARVKVGESFWWTETVSSPINFAGSTGTTTVIANDKASAPFTASVIDPFGATSPIKGALVSITTDNTFGWTGTQALTDNEEGIFNAGNLPTGLTYTIKVNAFGYLEKIVTHLHTSSPIPPIALEDDIMAPRDVDVDFEIKTDLTTPGDETVFIPVHPLITWTAPSPPTRLFMGYNLYRERDDAEDGTFVSSVKLNSAILTGTTLFSFEDEGFEDEPISDKDYRYRVVPVYNDTEQTASAVTTTRTIKKAPLVTITVNIGTSVSRPDFEAYVTVSNDAASPIVNYNATKKVDVKQNEVWSSVDFSGVSLDSSYNITVYTPNNDFVMQFRQETITLTPQNISFEIELEPYTESLFFESFENDDFDRWLNVDWSEAGAPDDLTWMVSDPNDMTVSEHLRSALSAHHGDRVAYSESWCADVLSVCVDPDNWLISPLIEIPDNAQGAYLWFFAAATQGATQTLSEYSYPEKYSVYIIDPADFDEFKTKVDDDNLSMEDIADLHDNYFVVSKTLHNWAWQPHRIDLSEYLPGSFHIAFRHHDSEGNHALKLDNIQVVYTGGEPAIISGKVVGIGDDSNGLAGAEVYANDVQKAITEADGLFEIDSFVGQFVNIEVRHPDYFTHRIANYEVETTTQSLGNITLTRAYTIAGKVVGDDYDNAGGLADVMISLAGGELADTIIHPATDASGYFDFGQQIAGTYTLTFTNDDYMTKELVINIATELSQLAEVKLNRYYTIAGTVVTGTPEVPLSNVTVALLYEDETPVPNASVITDSEGEFSFKAISGDYLLTFTHPDDDYIPIETSYTVSGDELDLYFIIEKDTSDVEEATIEPLVTGLRGNYPNPFNPSTSVQFSVETQHAVSVLIDIFNVRGQKVRSLVNGEYEAGVHTVVWNGTDDNGQPVGSGVYFYRMRAGDFMQTRRMLLLK